MLFRSYLRQAITGEKTPFGNLRKPIAVNALVSASKIFSTKKTSTKLKYAAETAAYLAAMPWNQPYRTYTGIKDMINGDTGDPFRLIWSKYALDQNKKHRRKKRGYKERTNPW